MDCPTLPQPDHELVRLRPLTLADLQPWFAYLSLPQVHEHTSWNVQRPEDLVDHVRDPQDTTPSSPLRLAIALRSTDALIGTAGFHSVSPQDRRAELAYDLAPAHWGRGIASAVCARLVDWAHHEAGIVRVQATVLSSNVRSAAVLQRCGFQQEGLLRAYRMVRGRPGDFLVYAHVLPPSSADTAPPAEAAQ